MSEPKYKICSAKPRSPYVWRQKNKAVPHLQQRLQPDFPTVPEIKCFSLHVMHLLTGLSVRFIFFRQWKHAFHRVCFVGHAYNTTALCYSDRLERCSCISFSALITLMNQSDCDYQSDFISLRHRKQTDLKREAHFSCKWRLLFFFFVTSNRTKAQYLFFHLENYE